MRFWGEVTVHTGAQFRGRILECADSKNEEERKSARDWIFEALDAESRLHQVVYDILGYDLYEDVQACLPAFQATDEFNFRLARKRLQQLWRELRRNYAFSLAGKVRLLIEHRNSDETRFWRYWRLKEILLPRMLVAIVIGFLLVAGNGGFTGFLSQVASMGSLWWEGSVVTVSVLCTAALAFAEVQRRVGRNEKLLFRSTARLVGYAIGWASVGGTLQYWLSPLIGISMPCQFAVIYSASAMATSFLAQLFWHDRSIAEPL